MTKYESFKDMPLAEPIQKALREKQYTKPSPIQAQAIPLLLEGRDLLGSAQTGTGKTAAFSLPILNNMHENPKKPKPKQFRALVLTPTRELAEQVHTSFAEYGKHLRTTTGKVYGGVSAQPQIRRLKQGIDVLVATPGRLMDLYRQRHLNFQSVEYFILDEADRMLDMGFINDIRAIVSELPERRQSLFFSATLSGPITQLAETILHQPAEVRIDPGAPTAEKIDHRVCFVRHEDKLSLLADLLQEHDSADDDSLCLVFSRTKHGADKLTKVIQKSGLGVEAIHGNKTQAARQKALEKFRSGRVKVLVATDVAARGIDVKGITLVINYDLPDEAEAYVHRIGRTARAGEEGSALSFCTSENMKELRAVEKLIGMKIVVDKEHAYHNERTEQRYAEGPRSKQGSKKRSPQKRNFKGGRSRRSGDDSRSDDRDFPKKRYGSSSAKKPSGKKPFRKFDDDKKPSSKKWAPKRDDRKGSAGPKRKFAAKKRSNSKIRFST